MCGFQVGPANIETEDGWHPDSIRKWFLPANQVCRLRVYGRRTGSGGDNGGVIGGDRGAAGEATGGSEVWPGRPKAGIGVGALFAIGAIPGPGGGAPGVPGTK